MSEPAQIDPALKQKLEHLAAMALAAARGEELEIIPMRSLTNDWQTAQSGMLYHLSDWIFLGSGEVRIKHNPHVCYKAEACSREFFSAEEARRCADIRQRAHGFVKPLRVYKCEEIL